MSIFDPSKGPVTTVSVDKGTSVTKGVSFEVFQAMQADQPVGALRLDWTRAGVGMQTIVGHGHGAYVPHWVRQIETVVGYTGRLIHFTDFWECATYDTLFRTAETQYVLKVRSKIDASHVLVQSKLMAMGVSVVNLAAGGILKSYTKRADFESVLVQHGLPAKRPVPV